MKLIATPLGLVSEAIHNRKGRTASISKEGTTEATKDVVQTPSLQEGQQPIVEIPADQADKLVETGLAVDAQGAEPTHEVVPDEDAMDRDEVDWALDDATDDAEAIQEIKQEQKPEEPTNELIGSIPSSNPPAYSRRDPNATAKLPYPVAIPQRRPGTKNRVFVRAYAPVLEEHHISQDIFLDFLKGFHLAAQASPIFDIVMVATTIAGAYPDPLIGLGVMAIQVAAAMGQEAQERYRMNRFLDQANNNIFIPNQLYAMIVSYKPSPDDNTVVSSESIDMGAMTVAKYGEKLLDSETDQANASEKNRLDDLRTKAKQFRAASGESKGEAEMPVICAPLIFPALDAAAAAASTQVDPNSTIDTAAMIKTKSKSAQKFVQDYLDRRGQATFVWSSTSNH